MARKSAVPVADGQFYCFKCETVKPVSAFQPRKEPTRPYNRPCNSCAAARRAERAEISRIMLETFERLERTRFDPPRYTYDPPARPMSVPYP